MKKEPIITLSNIKKTYTTSAGVKTQALRGVSLEIASGEFVAIMGPSGSGKSSLLHILGLLDRKFEGVYVLDGEDVSKLSANQAADTRGRKIGFVFQQFNLLQRTSVLDNVLLPTTYYGGKDDEMRALQALKQVGLAEWVNSRSNELSVGQIQRVAIARALIMNPSYLLGDEPTGSLDSKTAQEIMGIFQKINEQGTTIVLITHEKDIADYAKRIIHLRDGLIEQEARL